RGVETLRDRHLNECRALLGGTAVVEEVGAELSAMCDELAHLAEALSTLGHATPRAMDAVAAYGEQLAATLVSAVFAERGIDAEHLDARSVMITDECYMQAEPQTELIAERARNTVLPILQAGRVPVMGGFVGATTSGVTTTLGRGGSDYSASLIGAALGAEAIEIWTDVDGMLTADPRVVEGSRLIEKIRFDEASELASFGAKVLHPNTIAPAVRLGIPVFVYNSRRPEGKGTRITFDAPHRAVSAIAGKSDVTVIRVTAARMLLAHGFLRRVFEIFERHQTSVDVVATSEVSVSVTIDDPLHLDALLVDLRDLGDVSIERNRGIIAIVGAGLSDAGGAMGRALTALGDVKIQMMSLSATGINLTVIVDADSVKPAMQRLHREFFESEGR
ncbi:MAG: aspartate kinase, partial [Gemmatimonadota bacterium]|nr:aspartate kinase [Gemmatimonadota bacterium]